MAVGFDFNEKQKSNTNLKNKINDSTDLQSTNPKNKLKNPKNKSTNPNNTNRSSNLREIVERSNLRERLS